MSLYSDSTAFKHFCPTSRASGPSSLKHIMLFISFHFSLSLSLSLSHTHTHTHSISLSLILCVCMFMQETFVYICITCFAHVCIYRYIHMYICINRDQRTTSDVILKKASISETKSLTILECTICLGWLINQM